MSYAGITNGGLQPHVTDMARAQSDSLKVLIEEASRAEDVRVKQARTTKPKHRPAMEARFDRERQKEVGGGGVALALVLALVLALAAAAAVAVVVPGAAPTTTTAGRYALPTPPHLTLTPTRRWRTSNGRRRTTPTSWRRPCGGTIYHLARPTLQRPSMGRALARRRR